ncbi:MAG: hypothetical protein CL792_01635 [Chloroflexi bacterium]|nr:hypothetical protein [Chloroflexota bacterium]|tara:strand:- start:146 stop:934 length:789 start_codon:yes stop_codon:yes gene_type:complete
MKNIYQVSGMTCQGCADTIEAGIKASLKIESVIVDLEKSELTIISDFSYDNSSVDTILGNLGNYGIASSAGHSSFEIPLNNIQLMPSVTSKPNTKSLLTAVSEYFFSKKPILIALSIVIITSFSLQLSAENFDVNVWMKDYMGIFFVLFSFLKLLNIAGFSNTFKEYDIIAKYIPFFAVGYPFIELGLGLAFLSGTVLFFASLGTLLFMISQSIGVMNSLLHSQQIRCACMGSAVDLPISSLTLFENMVMIVMATYMIVHYL